MLPRHGVVICVALLVALGLVMVYSASYLSAEQDEERQDGYGVVRRHAVWIVVAGLGLLIGASVPSRFWRTFATPLLLLATGLLIAVLVPGFSREINGAHRWLRFGTIGVQPSEFAKVALVLWIASRSALSPDRLGSFWKGCLPHLAVVVLVAGLVVPEPDLGTAFFLGALGVMELLIIGVRFRHLVPLCTLTIPALVLLLWFRFPHFQQRIETFLHPERDLLGSGHQVHQSLIALGNGGWTGVGLGRSTQKLSFLPERHTDFITSVIGEELGLVGTGGVILLFALILINGRRIWRRAPTPFAAAAAAGLTLLLCFQAVMNIAVVTGSFPPKGIPLPFVSFGGSSLFFSLLAIGLLMRIGKEAEEVPRQASRGAIMLRAGEVSGRPGRNAPPTRLRGRR